MYSITDHPRANEILSIFTEILECRFLHLDRNCIEFDIEIVDNLDADGYTSYYLIPDEPYDTHYFNIEINSSMLDSAGVILSHELVHCEQYLSGRLTYLNDDIYMFDGKSYDISIIPYLELPWEIEAFAKE